MKEGMEKEFAEDSHNTQSTLAYFQCLTISDMLTFDLPYKPILPRLHPKNERL
jgi:hypothetical protein